MNFPTKLLLQSFAACLLLSGTAMNADSKNIADYPLRIHIFNRNETTFYHNRIEEEAKGEGRGNLFGNGAVKGVEFTFDCDQKLKASFGYETYPAKWKKPDQELTVLLPVFGKSNAYFTCRLKTAVKDFAYVAHDGKLGSETPAQFKAWMVKHDYDPEHGKDTPTKLDPVAPPAGQSAAAPQTQH
jgi:hypothetical protein